MKRLALTVLIASPWVALAALVGGLIVERKWMDESGECSLPVPPERYYTPKCGDTHSHIPPGNISGV